MAGKWLKIVILVVVPIVLGISILYVIPKWEVPNEGIAKRYQVELENENRRTLAQIMLGILVLGGAYLTWRRVRAAEQAVTVSQEQQITERFTRAVEQLGSSAVAIRLGGIYALERIARDSPDKDQRQVVEVLTAYLRENATFDRLRELVEQPGYQMPTDHQAILTVLGRRESDDLVINLSKTFLRKGDLRKAQLKNAILHLADLKQANLVDTDLENAFLSGANLNEAYLLRTNLAGAYLEVADPFDVDETSLPHVPTNLHYACLEGANLKGAHLRYAQLSSSFLTNAILEEADLRNAEGLTQAQLDTTMTYANALLPSNLASQAV